MKPEPKLLDFPWKHPPFEHQVDMARHHYENRNSLDLSDVGTGKTPAIITVLNHLARNSLNKILVIMPNSIIDNWAKELKAWSDLTFTILRGSKDKRIAALQQQKGTDVYLINYEGVRVIYPQLFAANFDCIVCDEIHHIKSWSAAQSKLILALAKGAYCRKGLTGTVLTKDIQDIWSICQFIDPEIFKTNFWGFRNKFMMDENAGKRWLTFPKWVAKPGAVEEIQKKLEPYAIRFAKREVLKFLPPVLFQKRMVDISPEQRKAYDELKRHFITELDSGEIVAGLQILPRITKMIEITSGFVYNEGQAVRFKHNAKLEELKRVLEEIGEERVIIWCAFREEIQLLIDYLGTVLPGNVASLYGDVNPALRQDIVNEFNRNGFRYLVCNPACAGEGLTLLAPYAIYFSRNWKLGERIQSLGRFDRPGAEQFENLTVIDLVARNTVDEEVLAAIEGKEDLLKSVNPESFRRMLQ